VIAGFNEMSDLLKKAKAGVEPTLEPTLSSTVLVAGNGGAGFNGDGYPATSTSFYNLYGVWGDDDGNIYLADYDNSRIRKMDSDEIVTTVAGSDSFSSTGGFGAATTIPIGYPWGIVGYEHVIYFSDEYFVWELDLSTGMMSNITDSDALNNPTGVAVSSSGIIYVADYSHRIFQIADGSVTVFAGTETADYCGDGGPATEACLCDPYGLWVNTDGMLFIADYSNNRIRCVTREGFIYTFAGGGGGGGGGGEYVASYSFGDGGLASEATLSRPSDVKGDSFGNICRRSFCFQHRNYLYFGLWQSKSSKNRKWDNYNRRRQWYCFFLWRWGPSNGCLFVLPDWFMGRFKWCPFHRGL
jgi:hypothetical protein